jgi:hypothetical protein
MSSPRSSASGMPPRCWFFHAWGRWEQYVEQGEKIFRWGKLAGRVVRYEERRQRRTCARCGKVQDEVISHD